MLFNFFFFRYLSIVVKNKEKFGKKSVDVALIPFGNNLIHAFITQSTYLNTQNLKF